RTAARPSRPRSPQGRAEPRPARPTPPEPVAAGPPPPLVGEAGTGRTRLAQWAGEAAGDRGRRVLEGRAVLAFAEPLGVVCDLVRAAGREGLEPRGADRLAAGFPSLVLPELGASTIEAANLGATFDAAVRYLRGLSGPRGLLVVLEDLHWADGTSLALVPFLARALSREPVALILTYRPEDEPGSPGLARLRAELH